MSGSGGGRWKRASSTSPTPYLTRELVARGRTYPHTGRGRQGLDPEVVALVVRTGTIRVM